MHRESKGCATLQVYPRRTPFPFRTVLAAENDSLFPGCGDTGASEDGENRAFMVGRWRAILPSEGLG
jgi:hypothetical protein